MQKSVGLQFSNFIAEVEPISAGDDSVLRRYLERTNPDDPKPSGNKESDKKQKYGARKASLFPTVDNLPISRPEDKYGRKKSIADFTKDVYNQKRSDVIEKGGTFFAYDVINDDKLNITRNK